MSPFPTRALRTMFTLKLAAMACVAAFALTPALARPKDDPPGQGKPAEAVEDLVSCAKSTLIASNAAYPMDCQGAFDGNIAKNQNPTAIFAFGGEELSFDYFDSLAGSGSAGTLALGQTIYGLFVLGIKGGPTYSLYLFDASDEGIDSIEFDTKGVAKGNGEAGPGLSHAVLFTPDGILTPAPVGTPAGGPAGDEEPGTVPAQSPTAPPTALQVPEPASGALALLALTAAGLTVRRRRR